ncbi:hypothetical protein K1719_016272 [Acacia pycnantha]|nr:hypothetical protein K1719_016272 [Acacia pycnantha]
MDNQLFLCQHRTGCFNSPRGLRSHMKMQKKKKLSGGGGGGVTSSSSSSNPPKDEAGGVLKTEMMALVELPLALQMIDPSSPNYNEAEDPCVQGSQRKGGVASSNPKDEAGVPTKSTTTEMMVHVDRQPLRLQKKAIVPSSSPRHYEAEGRRRCVQGSQRKGGVASSSNPKDEAGVPTKATTMEMMVHVDRQPLRLQLKATVPSSSPRNYEAEGRRRRGQGSQQQRREYVCVDCNMNFNSHYALGGHRSSKHSRKRLQQQTLLLPPAAPNNNNQVGLLLRRSQRLRLFGVNLDVVPEASSS